MKKHNEYTILGLAAMKRAAEQARELAAMHGLKIPVWRDGRVVYEDPVKRVEPARSKSRGR
ncbi:hypothetical protein JW916_04495 [Candidatus Sumerlaeota bacterium]|nr:hypothetical protein [Candidatus Sumerlaeota bacterium]